MRRLVGRRALAAIAAAVGVFAGAILGALFDSSIRDITVLVAVVATVTVLTLVVFTAVLSGLAQSVEDHRGGTGTALNNLKKEFTALRDSLGQTVEYQVIEDLNHRVKSTTEDPVTRAILSARLEILVLDVVDESGERPAHAMSDDLTEEFLDVLLRHVDETKTVEYHRICQMDDPRDKLPTASQHYYRHLTAMCQRRADNDYRFSVKAATVRYPVKFMLIDRRILMLQMNRYDRTPRRGREAWSELLFSDAEQALVTAFYDMWRDVDTDSHTRGLTEVDIAGPKYATE